MKEYHRKLFGDVVLKELLQRGQKRPILTYLEETHGHDFAQAFLMLTEDEKIL